MKKIKTKTKSISQLVLLSKRNTLRFLHKYCGIDRAPIVNDVNANKSLSDALCISSSRWVDLVISIRARNVHCVLGIEPLMHRFGLVGSLANRRFLISFLFVSSPGRSVDDRKLKQIQTFIIRKRQMKGFWNGRWGRTPLFVWASFQLNELWEWQFLKDQPMGHPPHWSSKHP